MMNSRGIDFVSEIFSNFKYKSLPKHDRKRRIKKSFIQPHTRIFIRSDFDSLFGTGTDNHAQLYLRDGYLAHLDQMRYNDNFKQTLDFKCMSLSSSIVHRVVFDIDCKECKDRQKSHENNPKSIVKFVAKLRSFLSGVTGASTVPIYVTFSSKTHGVHVIAHVSVHHVIYNQMQKYIYQNIAAAYLPASYQLDKDCRSFCIPFTRNHHETFFLDGLGNDFISGGKAADVCAVALESRYYDVEDETNRESWDGKTRLVSYDISAQRSSNDDEETAIAMDNKRKSNDSVIYSSNKKIRIECSSDTTSKSPEGSPSSIVTTEKEETLAVHAEYPVFDPSSTWGVEYSATVQWFSNTSLVRHPLSNIKKIIEKRAKSRNTLLYHSKAFRNAFFADKLNTRGEWRYFSPFANNVENFTKARYYRTACKPVYNHLKNTINICKGDDKKKTFQESNIFKFIIDSIFIMCFNDAYVAITLIEMANHYTCDNHTHCLDNIKKLVKFITEQRFPTPKTDDVFEVSPKIHTKLDWNDHLSLKEKQDIVFDVIHYLFVHESVSCVFADLITFKNLCIEDIALFGLIVCDERQIAYPWTLLNYAIATEKQYVFSLFTRQRTGGSSMVAVMIQMAFLYYNKIGELNRRDGSTFKVFVNFIHNLLSGYVHDPFLNIRNIKVILDTLILFRYDFITFLKTYVLQTMKRGEEVWYYNCEKYVELTNTATLTHILDVQFKVHSKKYPNISMTNAITDDHPKVEAVVSHFYPFEDRDLCFGGKLDFNTYVNSFECLFGCHFSFLFGDKDVSFSTHFDVDAFDIHVSLHNTIPDIIFELMLSTFGLILRQGVLPPPLDPYAIHMAQNPQNGYTRSSTSLQEYNIILNKSYNYFPKITQYVINLCLFEKKEVERFYPYAVSFIKTFQCTLLYFMHLTKKFPHFKYIFFDLQSIVDVFVSIEPFAQIGIDILGKNVVDVGTTDETITTEALLDADECDTGTLFIDESGTELPIGGEHVMNSNTVENTIKSIEYLNNVSQTQNVEELKAFLHKLTLQYASDNDPEATNVSSSKTTSASSSASVVTDRWWNFSTSEFKKRNQCKSSTPFVQHNNVQMSQLNDVSFIKRVRIQIKRYLETFQRNDDEDYELFLSVLHDKTNQYFPLPNSVLSRDTCDERFLLTVFLFTVFLVKRSYHCDTINKDILMPQSLIDFVVANNVSIRNTLWSFGEMISPYDFVIEDNMPATERDVHFVKEFLFGYKSINFVSLIENIANESNMLDEYGNAEQLITREKYLENQRACILSLLENDQEFFKNRSVKSKDVNLFESTSTIKDVNRYRESLVQLTRNGASYVKYIIEVCSFDVSTIQALESLCHLIIYPGNWMKQIIVLVGPPNTSKSSFLSILLSAFNLVSSTMGEESGKDNQPWKFLVETQRALILDEKEIPKSANEICTVLPTSTRKHHGNTQSMVATNGKLIFGMNQLTEINGHALFMRLYLIIFELKFINQVSDDYMITRRDFAHFLQNKITPVDKKMIYNFLHQFSAAANVRKLLEHVLSDRLQKAVQRLIPSIYAGFNALEKRSRVKPLDIAGLVNYIRSKTMMLLRNATNDDREDIPVTMPPESMKALHFRREASIEYRLIDDYNITGSNSMLNVVKESELKKMISQYIFKEGSQASKANIVKMFAWFTDHFASFLEPDRSLGLKFRLTGNKIFQLHLQEIRRANDRHCFSTMTKQD